MSEWRQAIHGPYPKWGWTVMSDEWLMSDEWGPRSEAHLGASSTMKSASLPTSSEPTRCERPSEKALLIVAAASAWLSERPHSVHARYIAIGCTHIYCVFKHSQIRIVHNFNVRLISNNNFKNITLKFAKKSHYFPLNFSQNLLINFPQNIYPVDRYRIPNFLMNWTLTSYIGINSFSC